MRQSRLFGILTASIMALATNFANAGYDLWGPVQNARIDGEGNLWFDMQTTAASSYCSAGWGGLSLFVPHDNPNFPYYYGILMLAVSKSKVVAVPNISVFNGTTPCDITKTGYGVMLQG